MNTTKKTTTTRTTTTENEPQQTTTTQTTTTEPAPPKSVDPLKIRYDQLWRLTSFIWLMAGVLEGLFAFRILFKLIAANANSVFVSLVYGITEPFLIFFQGIKANPAFEGFVLEVHTVFAMLIYAFATWVLIKVIWLLFYQPSKMAQSG